MLIYLFNNIKSAVFHLKSLGNEPSYPQKKVPSREKSGFSVMATPLPILGAKIQKCHRKVLEASSFFSSVKIHVHRLPIQRNNQTDAHKC